MKRIFLPTLLFFIFISCIGEISYGQVKKTAKDTIPEKKFVFVFDPPTYNYIDSVLTLSLAVTGYELPMKTGDGLRAGLKNIIDYLKRTSNYQDSVYNSQYKSKK